MEEEGRLSGYELSRHWFYFCFENPEAIPYGLIERYKVPKPDYMNGGFYAIRDVVSGRMYVGKSIDYMARLKSHCYASNHQLSVDKAIKDHPENFEFSLLLRYEAIGINFFNRRLETVIEQTFLAIAQEQDIQLFNRKIYGHLQVV